MKDDSDVCNDPNCKLPQSPKSSNIEGPRKPIEFEYTEKWCKHDAQKNECESELMEKSTSERHAATDLKSM